MHRQRPNVADQLTAVYEIGSAILSTLEIEKVLELVCDSAQRLLGASGACITEYRPDSEDFHLLACSGGISPARGKSFPARESLSGIALRERRTIIDNDVPTGPSRKVLPLLDIQVQRAVIALLHGRDCILGTLACISNEDHVGFTDEDATVLSALAAQAALAIENARTFQRERIRAEELERLRGLGDEHIRQLQSLHTAGVAINSDLDLDEILRRVAEEARVLTEARFGALGILNEDATDLKRFITSGLPEEQVARIGPPPTGEGLLGEVIRSGMPVRTPDAPGHEKSKGVPKHHPIPSSFLGVPVRIRDRVFGNLYLMNKEGDREFTEVDERIVEMLAAQAAVAIENARLFSDKERLLEELDAAHRSQSRLHAYVNHDIRNALHGVSLWAERLEGRADVGVDPRDPDHVREVARKIRRGSEHALRLVRDVLDLARLEEGKLQTWPRQVVVGELISAAVDAMAPEADRKSVGIVQAGEEERLELVSDPDRVLQITVNLLSNAVKFSSEGSTVRIGAEEDREGPEGSPVGDWVRLWVEDDGPGIRDEDLERIFGGFQQLHPNARERGTGVGLTLSRHLAEHMGGALSVESEVGKGSRFTLWLNRGQRPERREGWIG